MLADVWMAARVAWLLFVLLAPACHAWQVSTSSTRRCELRQLSTASGREALPVLWPRGPVRSREVLLDAASTDGGGASEPTSAKDSPPEADGAAEPAVVVDVVAREALDVIVKEELAVLAGQTPEEQETQLPTLLARVEARAADAAVGPAPPSGPAAAPASSLPTSLSSSTARRFVGRSGTRQQSSATRGAACS